MPYVSNFVIGGKSISVKDAECRQNLEKYQNENNEKVTTNSQNISANTQAINNNATAIESNKQSINYKGKTSYDCRYIVVIGDSFTAGDGLANPESENWAAQLIDIINPEKYVIKGYGGIGFLTPSPNAGNKNLQDAVNVAAGEISDKNDVTLVIIQGGRNDSASAYEDEYNAVTTTINNTRAAFPNAKICALFNLNYTIIGREQQTGGYAAFCDAGVPATGLGYTWLPFHAELIQSDKVHPNATGHNKIAHWFYIFMCGGGDWIETTGAISGLTGTSGWYKQAGDTVRFHLNGTAGNGPLASIGKPDFMELYFTDYSTFPIWRDGSGTTYLFTQNEEWFINTPGQSDTIGTFRADFTTQFPVY